MNSYQKFVIETNLYQEIDSYFDEIFYTAKNYISFKDKYTNIVSKFNQQEEDIVKDFFNAIHLDLKNNHFSSLNDYFKFISTYLIDKSYGRYFIFTLENLSVNLNKNEKKDLEWSFTWNMLDYILHNIFSCENEEILKPIILELYKTSIDKDSEDEFMIQQKTIQFRF